MKKHKKAPEWPGDIYARLPSDQQKLIRKMVAKMSARMKRGGLKLIQGERHTSLKGGKTMSLRESIILVLRRLYFYFRVGAHRLFVTVRLIGPLNLGEVYDDQHNPMVFYPSFGVVSWHPCAGAS